MFYKEITVGPDSTHDVDAVLRSNNGGSYGTSSFNKERLPLTLLIDELKENGEPGPYAIAPGCERMKSVVWDDSKDIDVSYMTDHGCSTLKLSGAVKQYNKFAACGYFTFHNVNTQHVGNGARVNVISFSSVTIKCEGAVCMVGRSGTVVGA